jgi:glycosyltransferase involved in cell wall biosynthesis
MRATGGLRVLHVGRVSARKGVPHLVEAVRKVRGAHLTLVGALDPGMKDFLRAHTSDVTVAGAVRGLDLPRWYGQADVFCLLSIEEGLALVLAQAMAMGLPVIATPNSGAEELIDDGVHGFIVPPRDPEAAAARLQQLADSPELGREMGERARARIADGFGWGDYGARARAHYERICVSRSSAHAVAS